MKLRTCLAVAALWAAFLLSLTLPGEVFAQQKYVDSDARDVVSGVPVIFSNSYGATVGGFGYQLTGSPTSVSILLQGCFADANGNEFSPALCETIETSTSTSSSIHKLASLSVTTAYDYFKITPTFSGGSSKKITIKKTLAPFAKNGGSAGGGTWGSITGTLANQTDLESALAGFLPLSLGGDTTIVPNGHQLILNDGTGNNISTFGPNAGSLEVDASALGLQSLAVNRKTTVDDGAPGLSVAVNSNDSFFNTGIQINYQNANAAHEDAGESNYVFFSGTGATPKPLLAAYGGAVNNINTNAPLHFGATFSSYQPNVDGEAGAMDAFASFYAWDLGQTFGGGVVSNLYYSWDDSRGVRRCKEDPAFNGTGQSICALYNNLFTKYTPGTPNFERIVFGEWDGSNVAHIGTEAGGTGTLRNLQLMGAHILLPVHSTTGTRYLCVDSTGTISASASACSGT